ncbi:MAG: PhoH family protein [Acidobacteria bacterium]|nr:PhoH family protein [Acidobacteriota bacterium]
MEDTLVRVQVPSNQQVAALVGEKDRFLRQVDEAFPDHSIHVRGNVISVDGPEAAAVAGLFEELVALVDTGRVLDESLIHSVIAMVRASESPADISSYEVMSINGRGVYPRSAGQKRYVEAMAEHVITFGLGPAGTGKSWLAIAMAIRALQRDEVDRILLTRPAVEAGERLGFLPGDLMAKIDPYLRPLYDALYDLLDLETVQSYLDRGIVEIAPLAFMRGRTLNSSFIILDEAQNTTPEQMKMFLTRIGFGSKVVVTGDTSQADVGRGQSGLGGLESILDGIDGLAFVHLSRHDVVRHRIVADIVEAYENDAEAGDR